MKNMDKIEMYFFKNIEKLEKVGFVCLMTYRKNRKHSEHKGFPVEIQ